MTKELPRVPLHRPHVQTDPIVEEEGSDGRAKWAREDRCNEGGTMKSLSLCVCVCVFVCVCLCLYLPLLYTVLFPVV